MLSFYKTALYTLLAVLLISILAALFCVKRTFLNVSLMPHDASELAWHPEIDNDNGEGGNSKVVINDYHYLLDYEVNIAPDVEYPFAGVAMVFDDEQGQAKWADLSDYSTISFNIKCSEKNVLTFIAFTPDEEVTDPDVYLTYRAPSSFFSCNEQWHEVEIDLTRLELAQWWLQMFEVELSKNDYSLDQVAKLQIGTTYQSPMEQDTRIQIGQVTLHGKDWKYMYILVVFLFVVWLGYIVWFFRRHSQALVEELQNKILRERPLVAYQQLTLEPQRDRTHDAILRYLSTEYASPELNLETVVSAIGVSRTKINEVLKAELGFTFTGYLNKLRLTEAARLLSSKDEANIAEIAYSVGYKNVSYFNKLFKEEYGCTPKAFKQIYEKTAD